MLRQHTPTPHDVLFAHDDPSVVVPTEPKRREVSQQLLLVTVRKTITKVRDEDAAVLLRIGALLDDRSDSLQDSDTGLGLSHGTAQDSTVKTENARRSRTCN
jgi:hypothetical protein